MMWQILLGPLAQPDLASMFQVVAENPAVAAARSNLGVALKASGRLEELLASIEKRAEGVSLSSDEAALAAKLKRKLEVIGKARGLAGTWDERLEGLIKDKEAVLQKVSVPLEKLITRPSPSPAWRSDPPSSPQV